TRNALAVSWGKRLHADGHESGTEPEEDHLSEDEGPSEAEPNIKRQRTIFSSSNP
ncbi:hypothetical protein A2U01_0065878, partial [Trifolium medium]|nr:hypothetical protein [Trifolium medium]